MDIVVGMPVTARAWILPRWFEAIEMQEVNVRYVCLYTPCEDETLQILKERDVEVLHDDRQFRKQHEIDLHHWGTLQTYVYMSEIRNRLLEYVYNSGADYFFSLDSDILLPPHALKTLLSFMETHEGVVAPFVDMVGPNPSGAVPNAMWWPFPEHPEQGLATRSERSVPSVSVVMAAMLMDRVGMQARWKADQQGEDIGFCRDCERKGIPRWWLPEIVCQHLMRVGS